jgi:ABC-type sugar transport system substrate-binding protein
MRKKLFTVLSLALLMAVSVAILPAQAQDRWDGADDLPVSPLECPGEAPATPDPDAEPVEYNGGSVVNPPDLSGGTVRVVEIPKLIGVGYFNAAKIGMEEAAAELGNIEYTQDGPTEANIDDQITFIDNYITQGVNAIFYAANDPVAIAPVLQRALESGIYVVGYDADAIPEARQWFVNQATFNGIAKALVDEMAAQKGEDASFAIVTSTFTTPNQARWIAEMQAYAEKCYPNMTWLETVEAQEDAVLSFNQANTLLNKYGEDLDGLFGMTSIATPAGADAITQAGLCGTVAMVGLATPNPMKPFVESGCTPTVILWNTVDLGYATMYVLNALLTGELQPGDTSVEAGRLGELQIINGSEILLGPPFAFTAENINDFDF